MTLALLITIPVSVLGLAAAAAAISSYLRTVKEKNRAFHLALLQETEERLLRFHPSAQGCNS